MIDWCIRLDLVREHSTLLSAVYKTVMSVAVLDMKWELYVLIVVSYHMLETKMLKLHFS